MLAHHRYELVDSGREFGKVSRLSDETGDRCVIGRPRTVLNVVKGLTEGG